MVTPNAGGRSHAIRLYTLFFLALFLSPIAGCDSVSPHTSSSDIPVATPTQDVPVSSLSSPTPTPTLLPSALHGPANFLLTVPLQFSTVSGSTKDGNGIITQLDEKTIEAGINGEFQHLLFEVDSNDNVKVYSPGATTPITTQVTRHVDGSVAIDYTQTSSSEAGSFSLTFEGVLSQNQLVALYEQQFSPLIISSVSASDVKVAFTTPVRWISTNEIPAPPANGVYRLASPGEIVLSWSEGQNAAAYDVYRLIPDRDQQFQLLGTVKTPSYDDNSPEAIQKAHLSSGIAYAIFSIGPTGVENPVSIVIAVSIQ